MHRSIWNENDSSRRRVKRCLRIKHSFATVSIAFTCFFFSVLLPFRLFSNRFFFSHDSHCVLTRYGKWIALDKMIYIKSRNGHN